MTAPGGQVWHLAQSVRWLDQVTLAGGAPYRVITLTGRGSQTVREILGGASGGHDPVVQELLVRLQDAGLLVAPAPAPADDFPVTVVIPARSAPGPVVDLLDRIGSATPVIVVDDGSAEPLAGLAVGRANVTVVRHPVSRGPGAARNTGAALVTTSWIAFLDADTRPDPGWIAALKGRIDQSDHTASQERNRVVLAAPRIYPLPGSGWGGWFENRVCALDLGGVPSDVGVGRTVSYVPSAAMLVETGTFRRCGGFDESMQVGEDVDLVWRLARFGRIRYLPDVRVGHQPRTSLWAALRRRVAYGTSAADLGRRHPGSLRHVDVSIYSFGPWVLGVLVHPLLGVVAAGVTAAIAPWGMPTLPPSKARKLAVQGHLLAAGALGRWLIRPMAPATLALGLARPGTGRRLALAAVGGLVYLVGLDVRSARLATDSRWVSARLAGESLIARTLDDLAYSTGVWIGVIRRRTLEPVLPRVRDLSLGRITSLGRTTRNRRAARV
ncbi:mycofactocin biosynthesis glycosyltransferase MftF [Nakamurella sp. PAMC28650]|uniref:mycofactocin biosynthesis glycosyltransferase MftF n=1 Tax=Nakamurella sp. PAMC28650 TaxID=2762325 RepID=UPI00164EACD3|nr:mycofactocin biosynthesis glycosyltransferase MftF [Nakamurella sp. PAMC28650]QNK80334.1 mycofactocin biosynthesis glycosyltransferase MftF [Nakamurella sp. PAMC28650]